MKKFLIAAPLALAAGALLSTPASAATWHLNAGQIRAEIQQLDRQIDHTRGLSHREEKLLENRVDRLQAQFRSYARNGFSRGELQRLDREVGAVKSQLYAASHDRDRRAGEHRMSEDRGRDTGSNGGGIRDHR